MLRRIKIAIADGHAAWRRSLRLLLEGHDSLVVGEAHTGIAAIELVDEHRPDVVIIDALLPLLNGLEATRVIASKYPKTRVIVYSPVSDDGVKTKALEAGAWHVVRKERYIKGLVNIIRNSHPAGSAQGERSVTQLEKQQT